MGKSLPISVKWQDNEFHPVPRPSDWSEWESIIAGVARALNVILDVTLTSNERGGWWVKALEPPPPDTGSPFRNQPIDHTALVREALLKAGKTVT